LTVTTVTTDNGSPVTSYHIQIDDGLGGSFTTIQGLTSNSLSLSVSKSTGVIAGRTYRVRYRARNAIGFGSYSDIGYILAARKPDTPVPPVITIEGTNAKLTFSLPYNGGSTIFRAQILFKHHNTVDWVEELTTCDGSQATILQARECIVPLTILRGTDFALVYGDYIIAKVLYENDIGESSYSIETVSPPMMQEVPNAPLTGPLRIDALTSGTTMGVYFSELTGADTRGSAIISYGLEVDSANNGAGPFTEVGGITTNSLLTQYTLTGLTAGQYYYFRYKARNQQGWGLESPVTQILMASVPSKITPAAISVNSDPNVIFTWTAPSSDGGAPVDYFRITFRAKDGTTHQYTASCPGTDPNILTCSVHMSVFWASPFLLLEGDPIIVIVEAHNEVGFSSPSDDTSTPAVV